MSYADYPQDLTFFPISKLDSYSLCRKGDGGSERLSNSS